MLNEIKSFYFSKKKRTDLIKKNIVRSFGLKVIEISISFLIVPISLAYLTQTDYGIWLIVSSMINWLKFFDIGISHGYRNKLAEALSINNVELAKIYTSTSYAIISLVGLLLAVIGMFIVPFVDWARVLNTDVMYKDVLVLVILVVFISFSIRLILKIITSIFLANQLPYINNLITVITNVITLVSLTVLILFTEGNLYYYAIIFSVIPLLILLITSLFVFHSKYKLYSPSLSHFDKNKIKDVMGLGMKFFIIQLGAVMLFLTDNIIIAHVLSPADVTPYQIALKYFSVVMIGFSIILTPYWSAITEAYQKNEMDWIKKSITMLNKMWVLVVIFSLLLLAIFYPFLKIWVGNDIHVPLLLSIQCVLFVILQTKNRIYTYFLNGTGKITMQLLTGILTLIINIPLSIFFAKYLNLGSAGVLLATNCSILIYVITRKIQYHKIINNTANGIWAK